MSKAKGLAWVLAAAALATGLALGLPAAARHVPWSVERWLAGVLGPPQLDAPCKGHGAPGSAAPLDTLVRRIYPLDAQDAALPITIEVIPGKTVNAFAALGGHIYVYDGLLQQARSPEELAGVLAHEIAHVRSRHVMQGMAVNLFTLAAIELVMPGSHPVGAQLALLFLTLKFSRQQEAQADELGLQRLQRARVDAAGFEDFFARAQKLPAPPDFLSNHPPSRERAELAARARGYPTTPIMDTGDWEALRAVCR